MKKPRLSVESLAVTALTVIVAIPVLLHVYFSLVVPTEDQRISRGDVAVIEIQTLHALKGTQLLGPYSRFEWNHPGPAYLYALAPTYELLGRTRAGIRVGALVVTLLAVLAILLVYRTQLGFRHFCVAAPLLAGYLLYMGNTLRSTWNPYVTVLPLALLILCCAAVAVRKNWALPAAAFVASFVVQTHVMYIPVVLAAVAAAVIIRFFSRSIERSGSKRSAAPWWIAAGIILALMWAPPVIEEISNSPGNISSLVSFFTEQGGEEGDLIPPLLAVAGAAAGPALRIPEALGLGQFPVALQAAAIALLALLLALSAWAWLRERKNGNRFNAALLILSWTGFAAALWSATRIVGEVHDYLVAWTSSLMLVALIAAAGTFSVAALSRTDTTRKASPRWAWAAAALALTIFPAALATINILQRGDAGSRLGSIERLISEPLLEHVERRGLGRFLLEVDEHHLWPQAAAVVLHLYKNDIDFAVREEWVHMFGRQFSASGEEGAVILVAERSRRDELRRDKRNTFIARSRRLCLFEVPLESAGAGAEP